jgi:hypothetical protein
MGMKLQNRRTSSSVELRPIFVVPTGQMHYIKHKYDAQGLGDTEKCSSLTENGIGQISYFSIEPFL